MLVQFESDNCVFPKQSEQFGEMGPNKEIIPTRETKLYKEDKIGLKVLDEKEKMHLVNYPGGHLQFGDVQILEDFIPFLFNEQDGVAPNNNRQAG